MNNQNSLNKQHVMLQHLCLLPKQILRLHGVPNSSEFVLHDLCHENCFGVKKAAYFVDNPDFNCVKGIAGFHKPEAYIPKMSIWDEIEQFSRHMKSSTFNQKVKNLELQHSIKNSQRSDEDIVHEIAHDLEFTDYSYCTWHSKHDNHGFLVYEKPHDKNETYFLEGGCLLGLCPII